jgi:lysophospholipase L1-like esterase
MNKWIIGGIIAAGIGALVFFSSSKARAQGAQRVLAVGDSFTAGSYPLQLEPLLGPGSTVTAMGYQGLGAKDIYDRVAGEIADGRYDVVVVLAGVNDLASNRGAATSYAWLSKMYHDAFAAGSYVIAVEVLPWGGTANGAARITETEALNQMINQADNVDAVISTREMGDGVSRLLPNYDSGAGLHLSKFGNAKLAQLVAAAINSRKE